MFFILYQAVSVSSEPAVYQPDTPFIPSVSLPKIKWVSRSEPNMCAISGLKQGIDTLLAKSSHLEGSLKLEMEWTN